MEAHIAVQAESRGESVQEPNLTPAIYSVYLNVANALFFFDAKICACIYLFIFVKGNLSFNHSARLFFIDTCLLPKYTVFWE